MSRTDGIVRFGDYEFDRRACELRRSGRRIPLQIQPFGVLGVLIDRAGEVVTREELRTIIWPATIHVDFDHGLNNAMTRLRRALEETPAAPKYIETLPRIGFRFIHPIEQPGAGGQTDPIERAPRNPALWVGLAAGVVLLIGVVGSYAPRWTGAEPEVNWGQAAQDRPTANDAAYEAYLRGLELFERRSKESVKLSIEYLTRATEIDPDFAAAYAALAMSYTAAGGNTLVRYLSADDVHAPALAAVERALQIDPGLAQAHTALAGVLNQLQPWSAATDVAIEQSYRRAIALEPRDANAYLFLGNFLSTRDRNSEAVSQYRLALQLDPLSPSINSRMGMELIALGNFEEGLAFLRKTVELDPWQFNAHVRLGWGYVVTDDLDAANSAFETAEQISPDSLRSLAGLAFVAARKGDVAGARTLLDAMLPRAEAIDDPLDIAIVYVALADRERSLEWLGKAARQSRSLRMTGPWGIQTPLYDWLRDDVRFAQIEREVAKRASPGTRLQQTL